MPLGGLLPYFTGQQSQAAAAPKKKMMDYFGTPIPVATQQRMEAGTPWLADRLLYGEGDMRRLAGDIERKEESRYQGGLDTATAAFNKASGVLDQDIDTGLLFSRAADSVGARAKEQTEALRRSLGARGMNPNSGAAGGMLQRLKFEREGALMGAQRDIAIENQQARWRNAALNFANALQLANYENSPVSGALLETEQNVYEGLLAQKGIAEQRKSAKEANSTNKTGAFIGAGASILGGLLGGL